MLAMKRILTFIRVVRRSCAYISFASFELSFHVSVMFRSKRRGWESIPKPRFVRIAAVDLARVWPHLNFRSRL